LWTQYLVLQTEHDLLVAADRLEPYRVKRATWAAHHSRLHEYRLLVANHRLALQLSRRGWAGAGAIEPVRARLQPKGAVPLRPAREPLPPVGAAGGRGLMTVDRRSV
jgi:hypothetical protein